jgi:hypothetical protein
MSFSNGVNCAGVFYTEGADHEGTIAQEITKCMKKDPKSFVSLRIEFKSCMFCDNVEMIVFSVKR